MDKKFHPTLYDVYNYFSVLASKLIHVSKRGPWTEKHHKVSSIKEKMGASQYENSLICIGILIIRMIQTQDRLIFIMVIPGPGKMVFILKRDPGPKRMYIETKCCYLDDNFVNEVSKMTPGVQPVTKKNDISVSINIVFAPH